MTQANDPLKARLQEQAIAEGFAAIGICRPDARPDTAERLAAFVEAGYHGDMKWMNERTHWRGSASALWPEARSVIMLAESYTPEVNPMEIVGQPEKGAISVYARGKDYHDIVKKRLKRLGRWLIEQAPGEEIKVFVDTAPVMEKPLAEAAGLGWQGKHTNLLGRGIGNWVFLGSIFTTVEFTPDKAEVQKCGSCTRCLDACPTGAFPAPFQMDATRCISYLTIEYAGPIALELREKMGNRIYGCDDCLSACPWNKFAVEARDMRFASKPGLDAPDLRDLAALDDTAFREKFSGSPIKRIGRNRFVRNVLYAIGNSGLPDLTPVAQGLADDPDPVVAEAAQWACSRIEELSCADQC